MTQDCEWRPSFEVRIAESEQQGREVGGVVGVEVRKQHGSDLSRVVAGLGQPPQVVRGRRRQHRL